MKRFIVSFTVGIITAITMLCGAMDANALGVGLAEYEIDIQYINAPEGTAFADILFKKVENDRYAPNAEQTSYTESDICHSVWRESGRIELDEHCGLAEYDDGFTSCMMRRCFVNDNVVHTDGCDLVWEPSSPGNGEVFEYYGEFKVAYCDKDGNVLLVTEPVKVKPKGYTLYEVCADGTKVEYEGTRDIGQYIGTAILAFIIGVPALGTAAIVGAILLPFGIMTVPEGQKKAPRVLLVLAAMGITAVVVGAICTVFVRFVFY